MEITKAFTKSFHAHFRQAVSELNEIVPPETEWRIGAGHDHHQLDDLLGAEFRDSAKCFRVRVAPDSKRDTPRRKPSAPLHRSAITRTVLIELEESVVFAR